MQPFKLHQSHAHADGKKQREIEIERERKTYAEQVSRRYNRESRKTPALAPSATATNWLAVGAACLYLYWGSEIAVML